ncbi:MAG: ribonuclease Z [Candidatus Micrarchaeia archaeon]
MRVIFLGTSGSTPTKTRNLPSVALEYNGSIYLFDCGEGTQRQMLRYSVNTSKVKAIFISHIHGDHVIGVAGLVRTMALNKRSKPLYIFVPRGYENSISALITFDKALIGFPIEVMPISSGKIYEEREFIVKAVKLNHFIPTYGFIFEEKEKIHFIKEKAEKLGLRGSMFSELAKRKKMLVSGKEIKLSDVTYKERGIKIAYITDTRPVPGIVKPLKDANLLIHEATFSSKDIALAKERKHSTSGEAAQIAARANVERLILMHISSRYRSTAKILNESRLIFRNSEIAKDGMVVDLGKGS